MNSASSQWWKSNKSNSFSVSSRSNDNNAHNLDSHKIQNNQARNKRDECNDFNKGNKEENEEEEDVSPSKRRRIEFSISDNEELIQIPSKNDHTTNNNPPDKPPIENQNETTNEQYEQIIFDEEDDEQTQQYSMSEEDRNLLSIDDTTQPYSSIIDNDDDNDDEEKENINGTDNEEKNITKKTERPKSQESPSAVAINTIDNSNRMLQIESPSFSESSQVNKSNPLPLFQGGDKNVGKQELSESSQVDIIGKPIPPPIQPLLSESVNVIKGGNRTTCIQNNPTSFIARNDNDRQLQVASQQTFSQSSQIGNISTPTAPPLNQSCAIPSTFSPQLSPIVMAQSPTHHYTKNADNKENTFTIRPNKVSLDSQNDSSAIDDTKGRDLITFQKVFGVLLRQIDDASDEMQHSCNNGLLKDCTIYFPRDFNQCLNKKDVNSNVSMDTNGEYDLNSLTKGRLCLLLNLCGAEVKDISSRNESQRLQHIVLIPKQLSSSSREELKSIHNTIKRGRSWKEPNKLYFVSLEWVLESILKFQVQDINDYTYDW